MKTKKVKHPKLTQKKLLIFQKNLNKRGETILTLLVVLISISIGIYYISNQYSKNGFLGFPLDDPWIHLQFAKNLIEYGSFSFFKNEMITSGSTSPIYTFISAILFLILKNEFIIGYLIGIFFFGLLTYFSFLLSKDEFNSNLAGIIFASLISLQPKLGLIAVSGMETTMFVFFIISTIYFYRREKFFIAGIFSGLSLWSRPEGLILIGVIFFDLIIQKLYFKTDFAKKFFVKKNLIQFFLPIFIITLLYFTFNYLLSESILPNTYKAKINYYYGSNRSAFLKRDVLNYFTQNEFILVSFLFLTGSLWIISNSLKRIYNQYFLYLSFLVVFIIAYYIQLPFSHRFGRYLMPVIPAYLFISIFGLQKILTYIKTKSKSDPANGLNLIYFVIIFFTLILSASEIPKNANEITFLAKYHYDRHVKIAEWLKQNTKPEDIIATHDIGAISFYSNRKIIDMVGLVNPEIIDKLLSKNSTGFLKEYFLRNNVSYFVTMRNWFEAVNQKPLYIPVNEFEFFEVFKFEPEKFHIMPKEATNYNQRAIYLIQNQNFLGAVNYLIRSLQIDPGSSRTLFLLGNVYDFLKYYDNAEMYLKRAVEIFPEYTEARYELARVYYIKQKYDQAENELLKAVEIKPDFKEAIQFLVEIYENTKRDSTNANKFREMLKNIE